MNNISNNPVGNRGMAADDQTQNTASNNSRSRGMVSSVGAFLSSALHGQIVRRSPADARIQNEPRAMQSGYPLVNSDLQLLFKPIKDVATTFQQIKRESEVKNRVFTYGKFHAAVAKGEIAVVKRLLNNKHIDIDSIGYSAIPYAVKNGQSAVVNLLLNGPCK